MNRAERSRGRSSHRRAEVRGGGRLVLPAASPYDWQLLCEHVTAAARQRGAVRLIVGGVDCLVRSQPADAERRCCGGCARPLARVAFRMAWRDLCRDCARRWLAREPGDAGVLAAARPG